MKTEILTKQDFQPIELKITIETKRELEFLWSLFNAPNTKLMELANDYRIGSISIFNVGAPNLNEIWDELENLNIVK